jgi:hypothetical protein
MTNPYVDSDTKTWPDLAIGLFEKLTGRGAEIAYDFENLQVHVPSRTGKDAEHAQWTLNGRVVIRTREIAARTP